MGFAVNQLAVGGWTHYTYGNYANQQDELTVTGQFQPAGSTTATATPLAIVSNKSLAGQPQGYTGQRGYNFQVIHDAAVTGQYDVLLDRDVVDVLNVSWDFSLNALPGTSPDVMQAINTDWIPNANANIKAGTNQQFHFACVYLVGVTPTDMPNNARNTITFQATLKMSGVAP